jgi:hypothetical protein
VSIARYSLVFNSPTWVCQFTNSVCQFTNWVCHFTNWVCHFTNWVCHFTNWVCQFTDWVCQFTNWLCQFINWVCQLTNWVRQFTNWVCQFTNLGSGLFGHRDERAKRFHAAKQIKAVITLQRVVRNWLWIHRARNRVAQRKKAATRIQAGFRGMKVRQNVFVKQVCAFGWR